MRGRDRRFINPSKAPGGPTLSAPKVSRPRISVIAALHDPMTVFVTDNLSCVMAPYHNRTN